MDSTSEKAAETGHTGNRVMPKIKTHRGAAKRFKRTATGKFMRHKAFKRHILTSKTRAASAACVAAVAVSPADAPKLARMLPYK